MPKEGGFLLKINTHAAEKHAVETVVGFVGESGGINGNKDHVVASGLQRPG